VLDETVDAIASDHSAYTIESKAQGGEDIFNAPLGVSGIQTLLPIFFDEAVNKRGMSETQFVRQIATNPAMMFGLHPRKGSIEIGSDADLVLFNPSTEWTVSGAEMLHRQKWTPFEGKTVKGRVIRTLRRGEVIFDDKAPGGAKTPGIPGSGRFLTRGYGARPD
jgi:allantoinase